MHIFQPCLSTNRTVYIALEPVWTGKIVCLIGMHVQLGQHCGMELPINTMVLNNCTMAIYKNRFPVAEVDPEIRTGS